MRSACSRQFSTAAAAATRSAPPPPPPPPGTPPFQVLTKYAPFHMPKPSPRLAAIHSAIASGSAMRSDDICAGVEDLGGNDGRHLYLDHVDSSAAAANKRARNAGSGARRRAQFIQRFDDAAVRGDIKEAERCFEWARSNSDKPPTRFEHNLVLKACAAAGDVDRAVVWLNRQVEEKFPQENFRVVSEMRILAKIRLEILDFMV